MTGVCRVCELIDYDTRPKTVLFCGLCQAWMCSRCRVDVWRRMQAAMLDTTRRFKAIVT